MLEPAPSVLSALALAVRQLPEPGMRRPLLGALLWSLLTLSLLWAAIAWGLHAWLAGERTVQWIVGILGALAAPFLSVLLFPAIATGILSLYAESIIRAVETRYYPTLPPPPATRWLDQFRSMMVLTVLGILANLVILPLYLFAPGANLVLFIGLNGYILGRGYYDLVALRRLDWTTARQSWHLYRTRFVLAGVAMAGLCSVPLANLLAPILGVAASVHLLARRFGR